MLINAFLLPEIWNKLSVLTTLKARKTKISLMVTFVIQQKYMFLAVSLPMLL